MLRNFDNQNCFRVLYMLANGRGKSRANREGEARKVPEWRVMLLSNGEVGIADKIAEAGGRIAAGMEVRMVDIRADASKGMGLFEDLHGAANAAAFAAQMKSAAAQVYGVAGPAFVAALLKDPQEIAAQIEACRSEFRAAHVPQGADGQVIRVADRFALVAAAGEMATALGLTGWDAGTATKAALRCFSDWLAERGGAGSSELTDAMRRLRDYIDEHGRSRFQRWDGSNSDRVVITNRAGFVRYEGDPDVEEVAASYYLTPGGLKTILAGLDFRGITGDLARAGVIVWQKASGKPALAKTHYVPSERDRVRLYQIDRTALDRLA